MVQYGAIPPLCDLFNCTDAKIIMVAMEGIENILKIGQKDTKTSDVNKFAELVEECHGVDMLEKLQEHENEDIYQKAHHILKKYFIVESQEDANLAPVQSQEGEFALRANMDTPYKF